MEDGTRPPPVQTQPQLLSVQEAPCSLWPGVPQGLVPPRLPPLEANRSRFSELPVAFSLELTPHDPEACRPLVRRVARRAPTRASLSLDGLGGGTALSGPPLLPLNPHTR